MQLGIIVCRRGKDSKLDSGTYAHTRPGTRLPFSSHPPPPPPRRPCYRASPSARKSDASIPNLSWTARAFESLRLRFHAHTKNRAELSQSRAQTHGKMHANRLAFQNAKMEPKCNRQLGHKLVSFESPHNSTKPSNLGHRITGFAQRRGNSQSSRLPRRRRSRWRGPARSRLHTAFGMPGLGLGRDW